MAGTAPTLSFRYLLNREERMRLANWLLVWVVLANMGFSLMYFVGSPPRSPAILLFGVLGLMVRSQPFIAQVVAFIAGLAYMVLSILGSLFNLPLHSLSRSITFMSELNAFSSFEYIAIGVGLTLLIVVTCLALRRPCHFTELRAVLMAVAVVALVALLDVYMTKGAQGHYKRLQSDEAPFSSAMSNANLLAHAGTPSHHLLVIMVESLGVPFENPELGQIIWGRYKNSAVRSRFEVSTGTTTYYGSTTSGEIRELCGRWGDYFDLVDRKDPSCLPAQLAQKGFEASAYHSFAGEFFERSAWYPNIGFQNQFFRTDLLKGGAAVCGGVFPSACDRDVPSQLAQRLKAADKPQFIYWLTVNSHLPVLEKNNLGVDNCASISAKLAAKFPMICRQTAIWDALDAAIIKEITAPDFPPTDILIVGDHMPPYFDRKSRLQWAPDKVPWLLLKWRKN